MSIVTAQVHPLNGTLFLCHTRCTLMNDGPLEQYFKNITQWVAQHSREVVTLFLTNPDNQDLSIFTGPIQQSGLRDFLYEPYKVPMTVEDWPTLSEMIETNRRVVLFLDYNANQTEVP